MNTTRSYKDLVVWQKGIELAKLIYDVTRRFPSKETSGLLAQTHAEGSAAELANQLIRAVDLKFCSSADAAPSFQLIEEQRRMLNALRRRLAARP